MNSSRLLIAALVGVAASMGCVPDRSSIEFVGASEPNLDESTCGWDGEKGTFSLLQGSMNTAITTNYVLVLSLVNNLPNNAVFSGSTEISPATRHDFYIREAEFTYSCEDTTSRCSGFTAPDPKVEQLAGFLPAGEAAEFLVGMVTPEAAEALANWGGAEPTTIVIGVKFRGEYASGAAGETDTINFPVRAHFTPPPSCGSFCTGGTNAGQVCTAVDQCPDVSTGTACSPGVKKLPSCPALFGLNGRNSYTCEVPGEETTTP